MPDFSRPVTGILKGVYRSFRRFLGVLTRPVRQSRGYQPVVIHPYRGYGTRDEVHLMGRVFHQPGFGSGLSPGSLRRHLADLLRRILRWGKGGVEVTARFAGGEARVETDRDGYFQVTVPLKEAPDPDELWHTVELETRAEGLLVQETGDVFIPPRSSRRVIISDIDDTVMETGVANKAQMMWNLFMTGAESRVAFPGVAEFYRALHQGPGGREPSPERNPMLYVSRAPWSIYEVLDRFFRRHNIPVGPILFLREWGLTLQRPLPRRAEDHKLDLIRDMLDRYDERPFILIGDSGQHDPEVYARVVEENPRRVAAVYIRDVGTDGERRKEIEGLARAMEEAGSPLVLTDDTRVMVAHAAEMGFVGEGAVAEVEGAVG